MKDTIDLGVMNGWSKETDALFDKLEACKIPEYDMDFIVFGHDWDSTLPKDYLTEKEKRIVLSTIQWLGSPIGRSFLERCGFVNTKK